jgi:hypothetical protein
MKNFKSIFATMLACVCVTLGFASCSSDSDDELPAAQAVAGSYHNDMTCTVMGSESTFEDLTFVVKTVDESHVTVVVPSFGSGSMLLPSFEVTPVVVTGSEEACVLAETDFSGTTDSGMAYSGTLAGTYENGTLNLNMSLKPGAMPMSLICTFSAPKK